ncbi:MAG: 2-dehydro-3-deoxyphosphogluconate aldolase [Actinomycetaceae bacterium]|nr:2-dehydro-3-deoxyphosphogluconate aldolase [Actinomycetaceae bacterium]MDU0970520.1 2-dehydro-3-deoxyphosphogluconate aldolase [Actinomycetaceae bacterium]
MDTKASRIHSIESTGVVLIVRTDSPESAYDVAEAAVEGGIRALEVPYAVPDALKVIERLAAKHDGDGVVVGAGTVLDAGSAYAAVSAGAQLLVSPVVTQEMLTIANRYQCVSVGGAFTPTEMLQTAELGADIVKLFPAEMFGPSYLRSVHTPLGQLPIMPTGGVTTDNVGEWFAAGAFSVGISSYICKAPSLAEATDRSRSLIDTIASVR